MGWLRKRFGESNTALGALMLYTVAVSVVPESKPVIDAIAAAAGLGFVVTPKAP